MKHFSSDIVECLRFGLPLVPLLHYS